MRNDSDFLSEVVYCAIISVLNIVSQNHGAFLSSALCVVRFLLLNDPSLSFAVVSAEDGSLRKKPRFDINVVFVLTPGLQNMFLSIIAHKSAVFVTMVVFPEEYHGLGLGLTILSEGCFV